MTVYIYALCDPETKEPRYVGQTGNLKTRLGEHMSGKFASRDKNEWIFSLPEPPLMVILARGVRVVSDELEALWIKVLHDKGAGLLNGMNTSAFQRGVPFFPLRDLEYHAYHARARFGLQRRIEGEHQCQMIEWYHARLEVKRQAKMGQWAEWIKKYEVVSIKHRKAS